MNLLPSGLPREIDNHEDIVRFLTQSSHFSAGVAKPSAFLPSQKDKETSVSRHGASPSEELWRIGKDSAGDRKLYGAALFKASVPRGAGLELVADEPPPRHAVIRGWPWLDQDPRMQKAKQMEKALIITRGADLILIDD